MGSVRFCRRDVNQPLNVNKTFRWKISCSGKQRVCGLHNMSDVGGELSSANSLYDLRISSTTKRSVLMRGDSASSFRAARKSILNKSSAVAEMGDRARENWAEKWGLLSPFVGELGPHLIQCRTGRGLPPHKVAS